MRWAIDVRFDGDNVYHKAANRFERTYAERWYDTRDRVYRELAARPPGWSTNPRSQPRCNVYVYLDELALCRHKLTLTLPNREEFPFGSLQEAGNNNYQILRFVSEKANSAHSKISFSEYGPLQQKLCC